jgi:hypothetical protein
VRERTRLNGYILCEDRGGVFVVRKKLCETVLIEVAIPKDWQAKLTTKSREHGFLSASEALRSLIKIFIET